MTPHQQTMKIIRHVAGTGYKPYAYVSTEENAVTIRDERRKYRPESDPSIGLLPDDTFVVWVKVTP